MASKRTLLSSLPLPPTSLRLLANAEFETVGDLDDLTAEELAEELGNGMDAEHAAKLLIMARSGGIGTSHFAPSRSALSLLQEERASRRIMTFSRELDDLLGGGVTLKQLTEFAGAPGVGKTQLAMQLALNVQIPAAFGGVGGRAAYVDSEGSFLAPRCLQMAEALVSYLRAAATNEDQRLAAARLEPRAMLDGILVFRVHDHIEQLAAVRAIANLQRDDDAAHASPPPPIRLAVVDSVAFHLRHADVSFTRRSQLIGSLGQALNGLALHGTDGHGLAAVCVNQVTTKVNDAINTSSLVPALGEHWAHTCNVQLMLTWRDSMRVATLYKGAQPGEAAYVVSAEGVRSRASMPPPSATHPPQPQPQLPPPQPPPLPHQPLVPTSFQQPDSFGRKRPAESLVAPPSSLPPALRQHGPG